MEKILIFLVGFIILNSPCISKNNKSIKEVDSSQYSIIQQYSLSDHPIGAQARTMLSQILESIQTLSIPTDTGYTRIGNNQEKSNNKFSLFPNPANENTVIKFLKTNSEVYTVSILDMLGKIQLEFAIKNEKEISLMDLSSGVYVVKLYKKGDLIESQKLIKVN